MQTSKTHWTPMLIERALQLYNMGIAPAEIDSELGLRFGATRNKLKHLRANMRAGKSIFRPVSQKRRRAKHELADDFNYSEHGPPIGYSPEITTGNGDALLMRLRQFHSDDENRKRDDLTERLSQ